MGTGGNGQHLLNTNFIYQMRVEIVLLHKAHADAKTKSGEWHSGGIIVKAHPANMGNAVLFAVNPEAMQMVITPAKGDLQGIV
jgi:hypothetical protein